MWVYRRVDFSNPNPSFYIFVFRLESWTFLHLPAFLLNALTFECWNEQRAHHPSNNEACVGFRDCKTKNNVTSWCKKNISSLSLPSLKMDWKKIVSLTSHPLINPKMDSKCTRQVHLATSSPKPEKSSESEGIQGLITTMALFLGQKMDLHKFSTFSNTTTSCHGKNAFRFFWFSPLSIVETSAVKIGWVGWKEVQVLKMKAIAIIARLPE